MLVATSATDTGLSKLRTDPSGKVTLTMIYPVSKQKSADTPRFSFTSI
jgi:hypothetical protein